jgi:hypothetical protein
LIVLSKNTSSKATASTMIEGLKALGADVSENIFPPENSAINVRGIATKKQECIENKKY